MESKLLRLIKESIKSSTLTYNAFSVLVAKLGYGDIDLAGQNARYKCFNHLKRQYAKYIGSKEFEHFEGDEKERVWVCWLQGLDNAPELIHACYKSICDNIEDMEIVLLSSENIRDYITLPDYIYEKWEKGIIPPAHFSDIVRLQLLIEHGGLWLDLTTYLTGGLPRYVTDNDFFVYRDGFFNHEVINMGSWLIHSKPNNILLQETQNLLFEYWKTKNYLHYYFLLHLFFRMVTDSYPEEWKQVEYYSQMDQHILAKEIERPYNEKRFNDLKKLTSIHKLSYKLDYSELDEDSYYKHLL